MRKVSTAPDFWVPEDSVFLTAGDCLHAHPDQAACGVLHMEWQAKYDRLKDFVAESCPHRCYYEGKHPACDSLECEILQELGEIK